MCSSRKPLASGASSMCPIARITRIAIYALIAIEIASRVSGTDTKPENSVPAVQKIATGSSSKARPEAAAGRRRRRCQAPWPARPASAVSGAPAAKGVGRRSAKEATRSNSSATPKRRASCHATSSASPRADRSLTIRATHSRSRYRSGTVSQRGGRVLDDARGQSANRAISCAARLSGVTVTGCGFSTSAFVVSVFAAVVGSAACPASLAGAACVGGGPAALAIARNVSISRDRCCGSCRTASARCASAGLNPGKVDAGGVDFSGVALGCAQTIAGLPTTARRTQARN